jgi:GntR family transcriptional regulator
MARPLNLSTETLDIPRRLRADRPKGDQIREIIEELATTLGPGALLPSDRSLADHFGVARMTVRNEVHRLVGDGVLDIRPASGTYVAESRRYPRAVGVSYSRDMGNRGMVPGARVLEHDVLEVSERLSTMLEVPSGTRALRVVRLRTADGQPMGVERSIVSLERFPGLENVDLAEASLYDTLKERWGVEPKKISATAMAALPTPEEAILLGIEPSQPCMVVNSRQRDAGGAVVETGRSIYRGDLYDLDVSYELST